MYSFQHNVPSQFSKNQRTVSSASSAATPSPPPSSPSSPTPSTRPSGAPTARSWPPGSSGEGCAPPAGGTRRRRRAARRCARGSQSSPSRCSTRSTGGSGRICLIQVRNVLSTILFKILFSNISSSFGKNFSPFPCNCSQVMAPVIFVVFADSGVLLPRFFYCSFFSHFSTHRTHFAFTPFCRQDRLHPSLLRDQAHPERPRLGEDELRGRLLRGRQDEKRLLGPGRTALPGDAPVGQGGKRIVIL